MSITQFAGTDAYIGPDDLKAINEAFSGALVQLGLHDRKDAMVELVARRIIRAALDGERDPLRLREIAVNGSGGATAA
jgi:hypothetical protein